MNILFVCTGNTCRSPMAQALAKHYLPSDTQIYSAGLQAWPGEPASQHAIEALLEKGIQLQDHRSGRIREERLDTVDLVLTMTEGQKDYLQSRFPRYIDKITTLAEQVGLKVDIRDPYGGTLEDYRLCAQELEGLIKALSHSIEAGTDRSATQPSRDKAEEE